MSRTACPLLAGCVLALVAFAAAAAAQPAAPPLDPQTIRQRLEEQKKPRQEVRIDPAILGNYVGYYLLRSHRVIAVSRKDNHLLTQLGVGDPVEVHPESAKKFFYKPGAAQISFITEADGRATALVLHQGGLNRTAPRIDEADAQKLRDDFAKRFKNETALSGSEAALRHQIESIEQGNPDLSAMSDDLAAVTRPQVPRMEHRFALAGPLQSLSFLGVGSAGTDIYEAKFAKSIMISRIVLAPDGKIYGLLFQWGP
jgi:hypothetical protein